MCLYRYIYINKSHLIVSAQEVRLRSTETQLEKLVNHTAGNIISASFNKSLIKPFN